MSPNSYLPSSPSGSRCRATETAKQRCAPPPSAGRAAFSFSRRRAFLPRCVGYEAHSLPASRPSLRARCHIPCPNIVISLVQTEVLGGFLCGLRTFHHCGLQWWPATNDGFNGGLQQLGIGHIGPRNHDAKRTAAALGKQAPLDPLLGAIRRVLADALLGIAHTFCGGLVWKFSGIAFFLAPLFPAPRALPKAQSADCQLQSTPWISSHLVSRTAHRMSKTPYVENAFAFPARHRAVDADIVAKLGWQMAPLAAGTGAVDDPLERLALVDAGTAHYWGWVIDGQNTLHRPPKVIGHVPDRGKRFGLVDNSGHRGRRSAGHRGRRR